jgi:hypothetical protein
MVSGLIRPAECEATYLTSRQPPQCSSLSKFLEDGLEGLVSKRREPPYQAGHSKHWLKVKSRTHPALLHPSDPIAATRANAQPVERLNELAILVPIWLASSAAAFS